MQIKLPYLYLEGLDYVPVQRNNGIDAILKQDVDGSPVPVRVQREGETILEAAHRLHKAAQGKNVSTMFLLATKPGRLYASGRRPAERSRRS